MFLFPLSGVNLIKGSGLPVQEANSQDSKSSLTKNSEKQATL